MILPSGAITYDTRLAIELCSGMPASYAPITFESASAATGNLLRHSLTENFVSVSILSCDTPITVAPYFLYSSTASANSCASIVQRFVQGAAPPAPTPPFPATHIDSLLDHSLRGARACCGQPEPVAALALCRIR